ncbi:P-type ATpase 3 integral membrane [Cryptosporidium xiaoi]|uniref:P-type ATpase 3 integral membrane n=1 Tax=Cryptosporidium xiaoi TaxID=659607 RepID=A0AAV9XZ30_9CRYT
MEFCYISVDLCLGLLYLTITTFAGLFLLNKLFWRRYGKHYLNNDKKEIVLIPCNKEIYNKVSLCLINFFTLLHLLILPIVVYNTVLTNGGSFPENWRRNAIVFLIEYSEILLICLSRKLFCRINTSLILPATLSECNHVFVLVKKDLESVDCSWKTNYSLSLTYRVGKLISLKFGEITDYIINSNIKGYNFYSCEVIRDEKSGVSYFILGTTRYVYSSESRTFYPQTQLEDLSTLDLIRTIENGGLTEKLAGEYLSIYGENINTGDCLSIWEIINNNVFTITFLMQYLMLSTTFFLKFFTWSFCWSGLILYTNITCIIRDFIHSTKIKKEREIINNRKYRVKRESKISVIESRYLVPLDIIIIGVGDIIPCDVILTNGSALVDESNLTGESIPIFKRSINIKSFPSERFDFDSNSKKEFILYAGSKILKIHGNYNSDILSNHVTCIVLNTGMFTNNFKITNGVSYKNENSITGKTKDNTCGKNNDMTEFHYDIPLLWTFMLIISIVVIIFQISISPFCIGSVFFILGTFMQLLPMWAPTTVLSTINMSASRLKRDFSISSFFPSRILFASKLKVLLFDKTGTLTFPEHTLSHVERLNEKILEDNGLSRDSFDILKIGISTCHSLNCDPDNPNSCFGDEIDREMLRYTNCRLHQEKISEEETRVYILDKEKGMCFRVLKIFYFSSASRCMSVIVRCERSGRIFLFSKGAPETIIGFCNKLHVTQGLSDLASYYSSNGSYVLIISFRELNSDNECFTEKYLSLVNSDRHNYEQALTPIGILCFSNSIRNEAGFVVGQIKDLGIQPIILTGDNSHCSLSVAKRVGIINSNVSFINKKCTNESVLNMKEDDLFSLRVNILDENEEIVVLAHISDSGNLIFQDEFKNHISVHDIINNLSNIRLVCTYEAFLHMDSIRSLPIKDEDGNDSLLRRDNTLLDLVLKNIVVISRSTHLDKLKVVEKLTNSGTVVGVVGDGSNDIAAMKRSNIGILINNNVNADTHFVIGNNNLTGVLNIIYEACNSASVSRSLYLFMIMYGITMVTCKNILLYFSQATLPVMGYFAYSILINFPSVWALKRSKPSKKIKDYPVNSELISKSTITILVGFVLIIGVNLIILLVSLSKKDWFVSSYSKNIKIPIHLFSRQDGFEPATVIIWMCSIHSHMALIFGFGGTHREPFYKNIWLMIFWLLSQIGIFTILFLNPSPLTCLFKINCNEDITPSSVLFVQVPKFTGNNVFPLSWKLEFTSWILTSFLLCIFTFKLSSYYNKNKHN